MKIKHWMVPTVVGVVMLLLGVAIGGWLGSGENGEEASDWLSMPTEDHSSSIKEKNMEMLGQIILLKKMLGEIDGDVVLLGPAGSYPIARGRLIWDTARMEGFIHAVKLKPVTGQWVIQGFDQGKLVASCKVAAPDEDGLLQQVFRPEGRLLRWDEFRLIRRNEQGEQEVALVGKRSL